MRAKAEGDFAGPAMRIVSCVTLAVHLAVAAALCPMATLWPRLRRFR